MRLSDNDKRVLVALGSNGELTDAELGRATKLRTHQARYIRSRLISSGVLRKQIMIDTFALGLGRYNLYCSWLPSAWKDRETFIRKLDRIPEVVFVQELGGEFELEIGIVAKTSREALEFCYSLPSELGENITAKSVTSRHLISYFPRKYLAKVGIPTTGWLVGGDPKIVECDKLDLDLLHTFSERPESSIRDLAKALGRPASTVESRLARLRKEKVLLGSFYSTAASLYGAESFKLLIFCRGFSRDFRRRLFTFVQTHPNGTFLNQSFGAWDFEIGVEAQNHATLLAFRVDLMTKFETEIARVSVLTRFKVHKQKKFGVKEWTKRGST